MAAFQPAPIPGLPHRPLLVRASLPAEGLEIFEDTLRLTIEKILGLSKPQLVHLTQANNIKISGRSKLYAVFKLSLSSRNFFIAAKRDMANAILVVAVYGGVQVESGP
jgi:hypothetical protein